MTTANREAYNKRAGEVRESSYVPVEQPMGILVAEQCKSMNVPYVIVTSGHLAHGDITTPIFAYMAIKSLATSDFSSGEEERNIIRDADKRKEETWKEALHTLYKRMKL